MDSIKSVSGLDLRPGMKFRYRGVMFNVTGTARKKTPAGIVNVVQVERPDTGARGYLELTADQSFTVAQ